MEFPFPFTCTCTCKSKSKSKGKTKGRRRGKPATRQAGVDDTNIKCIADSQQPLENLWCRRPFHSGHLPAHHYHAPNHLYPVGIAAMRRPSRQIPDNPPETIHCD
jgi:hypothetical protein